MGKNYKKVWDAAPFCLFWTKWRGMHRVAFDNDACFAHKMNMSFVCNLWSWANVYNSDRNRSLPDFLTWMGCK